MRADFEPLEYLGHHYDIRVLSAPLETLVLRRGLTSPRGSTDAMLSAVFVLDYEFILDAWARGVHGVAFEGDVHGRVCTCGLITGERPLHAVAGHLDTRTWSLADDVVFALPTSGLPM